MTDKQILQSLFKSVKSDIASEQIAKGIRASGRSADSMREEIEDSPEATELYIYGLSYLFTQETGTPPGTYVDYGDLYRWTIEKNIRPRGNKSRGEMVKAMQNKIFKQGTDIYQGKREGLDLQNILNRNLQTALKEIGSSQAVVYASDFVEQFNIE